MKLRKVIKISKEILGDEKIKTNERKKCLKQIQHKLKKKSKKLKKQLKEKNDKEIIKNIAKDLSVISVQRKKIIKELKIIKAQKDIKKRA